MALPLSKLFAVAVKQISKPVASRIKSYAQTHPDFRSVCNSLGQALHRLTITLFRRSRGDDDLVESLNVDSKSPESSLTPNSAGTGTGSGTGAAATGSQPSNCSATVSKAAQAIKPRPINPLKEDVAVKRGAEFMGEAFVFFVAAAITTEEYMRSREKENKKAIEKEERKQEKLRIMNERDTAMNHRISILEQKLQSLTEKLSQKEAGLRGIDNHNTKNKTTASSSSRIFSWWSTQ